MDTRGADTDHGQRVRRQYVSAHRACRSDGRSGGMRQRCCELSHDRAARREFGRPGAHATLVARWPSLTKNHKRVQGGREHGVSFKRRPFVRRAPCLSPANKILVNYSRDSRGIPGRQRRLSPPLAPRANGPRSASGARRASSR